MSRDYCAAIDPVTRPAARRSEKRVRAWDLDLAIRGGTVVLPETDGAAVDIAISNGRIAAVLAPGAAVDVAETLNVTERPYCPV